MTTHCRTRRTLFSSIPRKLIALSTAGLMTLSLISCATTGGAGSSVPYPGMEAEFIPDRVALGGSKSLNNIASTLPIFDPGDPKMWLRPKVSDPNVDGEWLVRAQGGQAPVRIKRLPSSPQGAQRIKVMVGPIPDTKESPPSIWIYELQRTNGGWIQPIPTS
ncbi:hypothetical protein [Haloferula sp.]|uniref:hypothetical protein n=1 Tax=Haloferula sp. TaxID=2497595 RepID=UPI003C78BAD2